MMDRTQHQQEVQAFLQRHISNKAWDLTLPVGSGHETYFAQCGDQTYFVKIGVQADRYQALAAVGLTPQVLAVGRLTDGESILVQAYVAGKNPSRREYRLHLTQFAAAIRQLHHNTALQKLLPQAPSDLYAAAGLEALSRLEQKWARWRAQVPQPAEFVDHSLGDLRQKIADFQGAGLVASHNDICNANWLVSTDGKVYLIDLESMSLDDPALDVGATLWWYYPPQLRESFLEEAGYPPDAAFQQRMQVRMAMHCLHILLPREQSFDVFDPDDFTQSLADFRAVLAGEENPQGYED